MSRAQISALNATKGHHSEGLKWLPHWHCQILNIWRKNNRRCWWARIRTSSLDSQRRANQFLLLGKKLFLARTVVPVSTVRPCFLLSPSFTLTLRELNWKT